MAGEVAPVRLLLTRPRAQADDWVRRMAALDVPTASLPLIDIAPAADPAGLAQAWSALPATDLAMFVSPNAVEHFFDRRRGERIIRAAHDRDPVPLLKPTRYFAPRSFRLAEADQARALLQVSCRFVHRHTRYFLDESQDRRAVGPGIDQIDGEPCFR